jgi:acyl CoA:acetate/3-ketoacid CoA transferase beta subunit
VIDVIPEGFQLVETSPGVTYEYVADRTAAPLLPIAADAKGSEP